MASVCEWILLSKTGRGPPLKSTFKFFEYGFPLKGGDSTLAFGTVLVNTFLADSAGPGLTPEFETPSGICSIPRGPSLTPLSPSQSPPYTPSAPRRKLLRVGGPLLATDAPLSKNCSRSLSLSSSPPCPVPPRTNASEQASWEIFIFFGGGDRGLSQFGTLHDILGTILRPPCSSDASVSGSRPG